VLQPVWEAPMITKITFERNKSFLDSPLVPWVLVTLMFTTGFVGACLIVFRV
jgi:hypothetical protein